MNAITRSAGTPAMNEGPAKVSECSEGFKDTSTRPTFQVPVYRSKARGPQGEVIWVQGKPLQPVTSPEKMAQLALDHRRDEWRRQFAFPANHVERSPEEHRRAIAALDGVEINDKSAVATLARSIADDWVG